MKGNRSGVVMGTVASPRRWLWGGAVAVFVTVAALVAATANDLGMTWDEPAYRHSQIGMERWFRRLVACRSVEEAKPLFEQRALLDAWDYNRYGPNFHPPLSGVLASLSRAAFGGVLGDLPARRMASGLELAAAAAARFLFLGRRYGVWCGSVAAVSLVIMPRVFGDAHIAGTDMPLVAFWGLAALAFWNGLESAAWRIVFGVVLGLALLVKFSAIMLVAPLVAWLVAYRALPHFTVRGLLHAAAATALVIAPLGAAGVEIVRLAGAIRRHTQEDIMLATAVARLRGLDYATVVGHAPPYSEQELQATRQETLKLSGRVLADGIGHAPPYSDAELHRAADALLREAAEAQDTSVAAIVGHAEPMTPHERKRAAQRLGVPSVVLDDYIAYVQPKFDLGASSPVPGWILFLPLGLWIGWLAASKLPFGYWVGLKNDPAFPPLSKAGTRGVTSQTDPVTRFAPAVMREAGGALRVWLAGWAIAPAVALALNPTWWHDTLAQLAHYYQISVGRQGALPDIEIFYWGKKYVYSLPWHNGWVLGGITVPVAILALALVGTGLAAWRARRDPLAIFLLLNMVTLPVARMFHTPAHDGVRLMLPAFFFLAGLAGVGFRWFGERIERLRTEEQPLDAVLAVIAGFLLLPPAYGLYRAHPHELSYYNGLVGGLPGAQRLGFEVTYWYDAVTPRVLGALNDPESGLPISAVFSLPEPRSIVEAITPVQLHGTPGMRTLPEVRINPEVFYVLQETGKLRADVRFYAPGAADFPYVGLLTHSSKASPYTRLLYALRPRAAWDHRGVRLFSLYDPAAVARAWALWLLLDASDDSTAIVTPHADREIIALAGRDYRALYAAALRVTRDGLDAALRSNEDRATMSVIRRLARHRDRLEFLLARRKAALEEAVEMVNNAASRRPELLERLIEYEGYLSAGALGDYLDDGLAPVHE